MTNKIDLNKQFKKALDLMENSSKNIFITGKAGTGKSTLLNYFCQNTERSVAVLAPTGVAAVNISGQTIHSFFKFKPEISIFEAKKKASWKKKERIYSNLRMIIIDEISMVRADLLDCVDIFLKTIFDNKKPFGGVQMVFFGDVYQLSPILKYQDEKVFKKEYKSEHFFDARAMDNFKFEFVELKKIYRQKDSNFIDLLNSIRDGSVTDGQIEVINKRFIEDYSGLPEGYIYLTTIKRIANQVNQLNLNEIPYESFVFKGHIQGKFNHNYIPAEINLELKQNAQIMLLNNDKEERWINGTVGKIIQLGREIVVVQLLNGDEVQVNPHKWDIYKMSYNNSKGKIIKKSIGSFTQFPISLAWGITIHKSQGKTFDKVIIDVGDGAFAYGQIYVALSRCQNLEGIILKKKIQRTDILTDQRVVEFLTSY